MSQDIHGSRERRPNRLEAEMERLRRPATAAPGPSRLSALKGLVWRTRDIIAANFAEPVDNGEDPAATIRAMIADMDETLVEVRASAARTIADQKEMQRHVGKLAQLQADWGERAQLAMSRGREDLARAALVERNRAADLAELLQAEIAVLEDALRAYEGDIDKLQNRLREARSRQAAIAARLESAENRVKVRTLLAGERVDEAMARFEHLERQVDAAEGRADALGLAQPSAHPNLAAQISALDGDDPLGAELEAMKRALPGGRLTGSD